MKIVTRIGKFRTLQRRTVTRRAVLEVAKEALLRLFLSVKRRRRAEVFIDGLRRYNICHLEEISLGR
jgi:hypothetical protein